MGAEMLWISEFPAAWKVERLMRIHNPGNVSLQAISMLPSKTAEHVISHNYYRLKSRNTVNTGSTEIHFR